MDIRRLKRAMRAHDNIYAAKQVYGEALEAAIPVGDEVTYRHGSHVRAATVLEVGSNGRLYLEGRSGARYVIDAWRILDHMIAAAERDGRDE